MDKKKVNLTGSESRDRFKQLHKQKLHNQFYALDIDFALVEKHLDATECGEALPLIVAILDFKLPNDTPTFSEVLAYNQFLEDNIPVYIVESASTEFVEKTPSEQRLTVYEYEGGDWRPDPPNWDGRVVLEEGTWSEFESWQDTLRIKRRNVEKVRHQVKKQVEETKNEVEDVETYRDVERLGEIILSDEEILKTLIDRLKSI